MSWADAERELSEMVLLLDADAIVVGYLKTPIDELQWSKIESSC
jgi:hypothetical protein